MELEESLKYQEKGLLTRAKDYVVDTAKSKAYWVDTAAATTFFNPLMLVNEVLIKGMSFGDSLKCRGTSAGLSLLISRPICKLRDYWGKRVWKINSENSGLKGIASDFSFAGITTPPLYVGVLALGNLFGNNLTFDEMLEITAIGTVISLVSLPIFGKYLEAWRRYSGTTPLEKELEARQEDI